MNKSDDMVHIMEQLHNYVPAKRYYEDLPNEDSEEVVQIPKAVIHPILFGGDQLTAVRARGAMSAKVNSCSRFDGLIPIAEDWHTKLNFLGVCKLCVIIVIFYTILHFHSYTCSLFQSHSLHLPTKFQHLKISICL